MFLNYYSFESWEGFYCNNFFSYLDLFLLARRIRFSWWLLGFHFHQPMLDWFGVLLGVEVTHSLWVLDLTLFFQMYDFLLDSRPLFSRVLVAFGVLL